MGNEKSPSIRKRSTPCLPSCMCIAVWDVGLASFGEGWFWVVPVYCSFHFFWFFELELAGRFASLGASGVGFGEVGLQFLDVDGGTGLCLLIGSQDDACGVDNSLVVGEEGLEAVGLLGDSIFDLFLRLLEL